MTELLHLPRFERAADHHKHTAKSNSSKKISQTTTVHDSHRTSITELHSPTFPKKTIVARAPSSGYGSGSASGSQSVADITYDHQDTISLSDEQDPSELNESQTDEPNLLFISECYGILHGSGNEFSVVSIKVNVREDDALSVNNDNNTEQDADKDVQTVAMPMLWISTISHPAADSDTSTSGRSTAPHHLPLSSTSTLSVPNGAVVYDLVDGPTPTTSVTALGCLESSRKYLWDVVNKCKNMLSHTSD